MTPAALPSLLEWWPDATLSPWADDDDRRGDEELADAFRLPPLSAASVDAVQSANHKGEFGRVWGAESGLPVTSDFMSVHGALIAEAVLAALPECETARALRVLHKKSKHDVCGRAKDIPLELSLVWGRPSTFRFPTPTDVDTRRTITPAATPPSRRVATSGSTPSSMSPAALLASAIAQAGLPLTALPDRSPTTSPLSMGQGGTGNHISRRGGRG